jgi:hypothetical protein
MKIKAPSTIQSYYNPTQAAALAAQWAELRREYGTLVTKYAALCFVPERAIYGKLLIENAAGNAAVVSSAGAVGLMQIKPLSATDMITIERRARRLTAEEKAEIKRLLPAKAAGLIAAQMGNTIITAADLKRPELNLLIGSIHLSTLIAEHTTADGVRFDLVGLRYNQGYYYRRATLQAYTGTTDELLKTLSGEAKNYVLKLCGKNGTLEITK